MDSRNKIAEWNSKRTPEERKELARKAGQASAKARRQYRSMRDTLKMILTLDVQDGSMARALESYGLEPSIANAIALNTSLKAGEGDVESARFVRDTMGEKPTESYNLGLSGKPIESLDLRTLSDEELEQLADGVD